jgi:hypothetical protein
METQEWKLKSDAVIDDENSSIQDNNNPLQNCKLKYTHVIKRGVTEVEYYGLKLASLTSYPPNIVQNALSIADTIVKTRKVSKYTYIEYTYK